MRCLRSGRFRAGQQQSNKEDLSTLAPTRPTIRIDGTTYQLRVLKEFGAVDLYHVRRLGNEAQAIQRVKPKDYTEQNAMDLSAILSEQINLIIIDLPPEVLAKLPDPMMADILEVFNNETLPLAPPVVEKDSPPTGEKSAPDSSDSTVETPAFHSQSHEETAYKKEDDMIEVNRRDRRSAHHTQQRV